MTREEALQAIKAKMDYYENDKRLRGAIETLVPELRESEDERIRKLLVWQVYRNIEDETNDLAQSVYDGIKGHDPDLEESIEDWKKCLAWLEKQKEQKPNFDTHWENGSMVCEQKEQKPAEKQDYSELTDFERAIHRGFLCAGLENVPVTIIKETAQDCLNHMKTAEWSEEDSDNLERVDNYLWMLDDYVGDDCATPQGKTDKIRGNIQEVLSPWLKSLPERFNLQPKKEWSEEDEKNCNRIIRFLEPHKTFFPTKETKEEMQNWLNNRLKSLRPQPHWKPSEEQMEALKDAVRLFKETHFDKFHYKIESLYEQLKKLI